MPLIEGRNKQKNKFFSSWAQLATVWSTAETCTVCHPLLQIGSTCVLFGHPTTTNWEYMCTVCGHPTTTNWEYMCSVSHYYELGVHMCTVCGQW